MMKTKKYQGAANLFLLVTLLQSKSVTYIIHVIQLGTLLSSGSKYHTDSSVLVSN